MAIKKATGVKEQRDAEDLGYVEKAERRIEDKGKAATELAVKKTDAHCTEEGCLELKAPGQTYLCVKHMRSN